MKTDQQLLTHLQENLNSRFNDSELRDLCFYLEVDYESLSGDRKNDKVRELVTYLERRSRIPKLIDKCSSLRPNIDWRTPVKNTPPNYLEWLHIKIPNFARDIKIRFVLVFFLTLLFILFIPSLFPREEVDDFDSFSLASEWKWFDPVGDANFDLNAQPSFIRISTPSNNDIAPFSNYDAPRLVRQVSGNFDIKTLVRFDPQNDYQGAGILIWQDDDNFLRVERAYGGFNGGQSGIRFDKEVNGSYGTVSGPESHPTVAKEVELRVKREGDQFTAYWRERGDSWQEIGTTSLQFTSKIDVGLAVVAHVGVPQTTADFDYFIISHTGLPFLRWTRR